MRLLWVTLACLLLALPALAQNNVPVFQSGLQTPRHAPMFLDNGVIGDSGPAGGGALGVGLSELGITNTGTPFCINDTAVTDPGGYHQLCIGANALGGGLLSYQAYAGAPALPFLCNVNGVTQPCLGGALPVITAVPDNVTLMNTSTASWGQGVWRLDFAAGYGAPPQFYRASNSPCPLNSGNGDNGSQVKSSNGTCWLAAWNSWVDVRQFGATSQISDNSAPFNAAFAASCANGFTLYIAAGSYPFTVAPTDPHCGPSIFQDAGAKTIDNIVPVTTFTQMFRFTGTEGATTPLTGNSLQWSSTVAVTSAAGWLALPDCAGLDGVTVHPGCAARVASNAVWDPSISNHKIGEIKMVCQISGNTLTLCDPLEDDYKVADSAIASPVAMITGFSWTGGTLQGPTINNNHEGIYLRYAYFPTIKNTTFTGFASCGDIVFSDSWYPSDLNTTFIGISTAATGSCSYAAVDENATEYSFHDGIKCYRTGPCYTAAYDSFVPSSTRHVIVSNGRAENITSFNSFAFQTHSMGADFNFYNNIAVWNDVSVNSHCYDVAVPYVNIVNNKCTNTVGYGVAAKNYTQRSGSAILSGNIVDGALICILALQGASSSTGEFTSVHIIGNLGANCQHQGLLVESDNGTNVPRMIVTNNLIASADLSGIGYPAMMTQATGGGAIYDTTFTGNVVKGPAIDHSGNGFYLGNLTRGTFSGNTADGSGAPADAVIIEGTDNQYITYSGNSIKMPPASTGSGFYLNQNAVPCVGNIVQGNTINDPSPVSSKGFVQDTTCTNTIVGTNNFAESSLWWSPGTGSGNHRTMPLTGQSSSLLPTAGGTCANELVSIGGTLAGDVVTVSPETYPGDLITFNGVAATNVVRVKVCAPAGSTPVGSIYDVSTTR